MASATSPGVDAGEPMMVDPRAPRFGQAVTATLLAIGIVTQHPGFVYAVTAILGVAAVSGWRVDLYSFIWQELLRPVVGTPTSTDAAAPHRFAKLVGAVFTLVASLLLVSGFATAGYVVAGIVMVLAGIAAAFDLCVGCRLYREVAFFQRLGWV